MPVVQVNKPGATKKLGKLETAATIAGLGKTAVSLGTGLADLGGDDELSKAFSALRLGKESPSVAKRIDSDTLKFFNVRQ